MKKLIILIAISLFTIMNCSLDPKMSSKIDDHFFLRNNDADMPVFVKGDGDSKTFLIWIHGGPGGGTWYLKFNEDKFFDSMENKETKKFVEMAEDEYVNVYWDQRCAGASTGNFDPDEMTVETHVEDLKKLIILLKDIYGDDNKYILVGHSWGGTLSYAFLTTENYQEMVDGFIDLAGPTNIPQTAIESKKMVLEVANRQIAAGIKKSEWKDIVKEMDKLNEYNTENFFDINTIAHEAKNILEEIDTINTLTLSPTQFKSLFGSPSMVTTIFNKQFVTYGSTFTDEFIEIEMDNQLEKINLPSLFLVGKYDFVCPPVFIKEAYEKVSSTNKYIHIFNRSHHAPNLTEPNEFMDVIDIFISNL